MTDSISGLLYDCNGKPRHFWSRLQVMIFLAFLSFGWSGVGYVVGDAVATNRAGVAHLAELGRMQEIYATKINRAGRGVENAARATANAARAVEEAQIEQSKK